MRALLLAVIVLCGCDVNDEGSFHIVFEWQDEPPDEDTELYVVARVEEGWQDGEGEVLASAGPDRFRSGLELRFDEVPIGAERRVVVELREQAGSSAQIIYYGISDPFDMKAGADTAVEVRLALRQTPGADPGREVGIAADLRAQGISPSSDVRLLATTDTAVVVELSNRAGLPPEHTETFELNDDNAADIDAAEGLRVHALDWDLDQGLDTRCDNQNFCRRQVFARFIDAEGYRSRIYDTQVVIDSKPAAVLLDTVQVVLVPRDDNPLNTPKLDDLIERVTTGTVVRLAFTLDEPAATPPEVVAVSDAGDRLAFTRTMVEPDGYPEGGITFFSYELEYTDDAPVDELAFDIEITAVDKALTESTTILPDPFVVDTTPPEAPKSPSGTAATLIYERNPWGEPDDPTASYYLSAAPESVESSSVLRVYSGAEPEQAEVVAEAQANEDGSIDRLLLPRADRPALYVQVIDRAGNARSEASLVRDVRWTATLAGRIADSDLDNPHAFEQRSFFLPSLHQDDALEVDGEALVSEGEGGDGAVRVVGAGRWQRTKPIPTPDPRAWPAMTLDRARGRVVMFGGDAYDDNCDDANTGACGGPQEWSGYAWQARPTPAAQAQPAPRDGHDLTWDGARGLTLIFGGKAALGSCGTASSAFCSDLWGYDGQRYVLLDPGDSAEGPIARDGASLNYDWKNEHTVLFGGLSASETDGCIDRLCNDTWAWDGRAWAQLEAGGEPTAERPNGRSRHAVAYDEAREQLVLFGGEADAARFNDTWIFDDDGWRLMPAPEGMPQPSGRRDAAMAYSSRLGRVVLFGGEAAYLCDDSPDRWCNALWSFNGTSWERIAEPTPHLPAPAPRGRIAMIEDAFGQLVVFGGLSGTQQGDCDIPYPPNGFGCRGQWVWEGEHWRERAGVTSENLPSNRFNHSMAFDPSTGLSYLTGGRAFAVSECLPSLGPVPLVNDLWRWDGNGWHAISTAGEGPGTREGATLVGFDDKAPVLIGGAAAHYPGLRDTGADICAGDLEGTYPIEGFDLDAEAWVTSSLALAASGSDAPLARSDQAAVGTRGGKLVVVGGRRDCEDLADAWSFDGASWQAMNSSALPELNSATLAYHEALDQVLLFGGSSTYTAGDAAMASDAGCTACRCVHGATYLAEDGEWIAQHPDHEPHARGDAAAAYVSSRESILLTGGFTSDDCGAGDRRCSDLWEWIDGDWHASTPADPEGDGNPSGREQHTLIEDRARGELMMFGGTVNPNDGAWLFHPDADARPAQVARFDFSSALAPEDTELLAVDLDWKASADSGSGDDTELRVWYRGRFEAPTVAGLAADGEHWRGSDSALLRRLPYGARDTLTFALMPAADNGTHAGYASVETDLVTLRIDYRLP